ncbi:Nsp1-like C-terminal region-domain-containing protein [Hysterangium stoloniferum]|nr:Nsp1-like C-terminal region-domain-containing protein [Hysterangium stoloniferum]
MSNDQQSQSNTTSPFGAKQSTTQPTNPSASGFGAFASTKSPFATTTGNAFANPDSSATSKPSLFGSGGFGQNPQSGGSGGNIFGSGPSPFSGGGQTGSALGSSVTQPGGSGGSSIFGSSSGGLLGGAQTGNANTSGSGVSTTAVSNTTPNSLFGGGSTATVTPAPTSSGLFGSQQTNKPGGSGVTPPSSIFGGQAPLGSQSATSAGGFNGGGTATATTTPTPSLSNPLFGGASKPPFGSTPLVPPSGGLFGGQPASQPGSTASTLSNALGGKPSTTPSTASASSLFGGGSTGVTNSASSGSTSSAVPASSALGALPAISGTGAPPTSTILPSLFGSGPPKKPETAPAPATSSAPSGFSILGAAKEGAKDATKEDKTAAGATSKDQTPAGFGQPKDATSPKPAEASGGTAPAVPAPSMLRGKTVEDIVNRWTTELEVHTREFSQFASEVAVWDRTLIENGNYISGLYASVIQAESTQASLDQTLDHVEQQQRQLNATLDQYEKTANDILRGPGGIMASTEGLGLADSERDKSYALAANLYTQLDDLSRSLTQMVDMVNSLNLSQTPSSKATSADNTAQDDPISTIAGILNAHLSSLQWIDGSLKDMEGKVKDAQRKLRDTEGGRGPGVSGTGRSYGLGSTYR